MGCKKAYLACELFLYGMDTSSECLATPVSICAVFSKKPVLSKLLGKQLSVVRELIFTRPYVLDILSR